eukprot:TRINITY_DN6668_c0_g1_i2.p1 TRINITY_DN6668_c0_g1~~TRINITY_DN6668_c0_g1_i2.p1  ORF type:complete len:381 (+),score=100.73 TRINITY_DN6668_c0_g1_i2:26-1144(+)
MCCGRKTMSKRPLDRSVDDFVGGLSLPIGKDGDDAPSAKRSRVADDAAKVCLRSNDGAEFTVNKQIIMRNYSETFIAEALNNDTRAAKIDVNIDSKQLKLIVEFFQQGKLDLVGHYHNTVRRALNYVGVSREALANAEHALVLDLIPEIVFHDDQESSQSTSILQKIEASKRQRVQKANVEPLRMLLQKTVGKETCPGLEIRQVYIEKHWEYCHYCGEGGHSSLSVNITVKDDVNFGMTTHDDCRSKGCLPIYISGKGTRCVIGQCMTWSVSEVTDAEAWFEIGKCGRFLKDFSARQAGNILDIEEEAHLEKWLSVLTCWICWWVQEDLHDRAVWRGQSFALGDGLLKLAFECKSTEEDQDHFDQDDFCDDY